MRALFRKPVAGITKLLKKIFANGQKSIAKKHSVFFSGSRLITWSLKIRKTKYECGFVRKKGINYLQETGKLY